MSDDEDHTVADSFLAAATACSGSQKSSDGGQLHLLAEHAAGGVDVAYRQRRAALHLLAEPGYLPRHRARHPIRISAPAGAPSTAIRMALTRSSLRQTTVEPSSPW